MLKRFPCYHNYKRSNSISMMDFTSKLSLSHMPYGRELLSRAPCGYLEAVRYDTIGVGAQFEEIVSRALQNEQYKYDIEANCLDDGDLVVFSAISNDGTLCEAQCFKKCKLPDKLYLSRKRRIQRLRKSSNLLHEVNQKEVRILVSRIPENTPRNCRKCPAMGAETKTQYACSIKEFPPLCNGSRSRGSTVGDIKWAKPSTEGISLTKPTASRLGWKKMTTNTLNKKVTVSVTQFSQLPIDPFDPLF
ncbi:hypothetical protein F4860DRAFT_492846 [Xylaria cubensis]|nr:hypothetical protein F4860DRAFT_492846 [Xylaria cubensis]